MSNIQIVAAALTAAYTLLDGINRQHGKGSISSISVDVNKTDLSSGVVKGHVTRNYAGGDDSRTFSLNAKANGKVNVRFLNKRQTVSAN